MTRNNRITLDRRFRKPIDLVSGPICFDAQRFVGEGDRAMDQVLPGSKENATGNPATRIVSTPGFAPYR